MNLWLTKIGLVAALGGMAAVAHAQTGQHGQAAQGRAGQSDQGAPTAADEQFLKEAYSISKGEVMLGKICPRSEGH